MTLFRPHAKCTICESVPWLQVSQESLRARILFQGNIGLFGYKRVEKSFLGKRGRRSVCGLAHKYSVVGRSFTFQNLLNRKQADLKVKSGGWVIPHVVTRCQ